MARWFYAGRTPSPVVFPGRGSVVLTYGTRFEADEGSVHHLVQAGYVKRIADAPKMTPQPEVAAPEAFPAEEVIAEEVAPPTEQRVDGDIPVEDVVESPSSSEVEGAEEVRTEAQAPAVEEKKQETPKRRRKERASES